MPIIWTFNCFLGCTHDPQSKYSAYLRIILDNKSFWMYFSLNQSFWRLKKSSTSCPNLGGGNTFVHSANSALSLSLNHFPPSYHESLESLISNWSIGWHMEDDCAPLFVYWPAAAAAAACVWASSTAEQTPGRNKRKKPETPNILFSYFLLRTITFW